MQKRLFLIGAADSIGVPYTRDNASHYGFFEMVENYLKNNYDIITANCFHMSDYNDNKYISQLIHQNISLAKIKRTQNDMLKKCKYSGIYPYIELPKSFLGHYKITKSDKDIIVKECIEKYKTIFIYSAFTNDLLKAYDLSLFKLLRPRKIKTSLKTADVSFVYQNLKNNLSSLIRLNPNIEIYLIGLFIPSKINYIRNGLSSFIEETNRSFLNIAKTYPNVHFVNNSNLAPEDFNNIDFHPNHKGHIKIYQNFMKVYKVVHR